MNIGIIGTGKMGTGLAKLWNAAGHSVMLGSRTPAKAQEVAASIDTKVRSGAYADAVQFADVIVLTVPFSAAQEVLESLGDLGGKVLIEITNDLSGGELGAQSTQRIVSWATNARVVKAYNTIFSYILHAEIAPGASRGAVFVAADDAEAKATVLRLVGDSGFNPIDFGGLEKAEYLDTMVRVIIEIGRRQGWYSNFQIIDVAKL